MMEKRAVAIAGLALSLGLTLGTPALGADDDSVEAMAAILIDLNHVPTDAQKQKLQAIADNDSAGEQERAVAKAMMNLKHKATAADKEEMQSIMDDESASAEVRDLAGVVYRLNHKPDDSDRAKLSALISD